MSDQANSKIHYKVILASPCLKVVYFAIPAPSDSGPAACSITINIGIHTSATVPLRQSLSSPNLKILPHTSRRATGTQLV
jgi:hypothetical protein